MFTKKMISAAKEIVTDRIALLNELSRKENELWEKMLTATTNPIVDNKDLETMKIVNESLFPINIHQETADAMEYLELLEYENLSRMDDRQVSSWLHQHSRYHRRISSTAEN